MVGYKIKGGGLIRDGRIIDIGEYHEIPNVNEFKIGFKYERTDGFDWYVKSYDRYQYGDVRVLLKQKRIRVLKPWYERVLIYLKKILNKFA